MFKTESDLTPSLVLAACFSILGFLILAIWGTWHQTDYRAADALHRFSANNGYSPPASPRICYLTVTDKTYEAFNESQLNRVRLAEANDILSDLGAQAIVYDLIFARPSTPQADQRFRDSIAKNGHVFLPTGFALRRRSLTQDRSGPFISEESGAPEVTRETGQLPDLLKAARGTGHVSAPSDRDGVYRRFYMLVKRGEGYVPALSLAAFLDYAGLGESALEIQWGNYIRIKKGESTVLTEDIFIPIDDAGRALIPFTGYWAKDFEKMSMQRLMEFHADEAKRGNLINFFENRFVLIGDVSTGIADAGATPLENDVPLVALHAALLNAFLTGNFFDYWRTGRVALFLIAAFSLLAFAVCFRRNRIFHLSAASIFLLLIGLWIFSFYRYSLLPVFTSGVIYTIVYAGVAGSIQIRNYKQNLRLRQENALLRRELDIAARIQHQMLPQVLPDRGDVEVAGINLQALSVGGDFYDVIETEDQRMWLFTGDVSGKGIPAALYMSGIMSSLRTILQTTEDRSPRNLLLMLNDVMARRVPDHEVSAFATAVLVLLDPQRLKMVVARCGHELPILWNPETRELREVKPSGFMLGVSNSKIIGKMVNEITVDLSRGEMIYFYSDGISEAANPEGEFYGVHRLKEAIKTYGAGPAAEVRDAILSDIQAFTRTAPQHDDITLLVARVHGP
ncbi:MAG: SpoIIE family protein phosphatase [Leptospirales bacterium]|nr:SpoIIE family protein phosphatase [Leptospirales bacterium]